jgi:subtilase family serine protease
MPGSRPAARRPHRLLRWQNLATAAAVVLALAGCQTVRSAASAHPADALDCLAVTPAPCYPPRLFRVAYGITPLLDHGIDGRGQTVVLPEPAVQPGAAGTSDVRSDLSLFDRLFGLPATQLTVDTRLAGSASPYLAGDEEAEDAEMVHAVAPGATIRVILLPASNDSAQAITNEYVTALRLAPSLGGVVSTSAGLAERCFTPAEVTMLNSALETDRDQRVTVVASSGDYGAATHPCAGRTAPAEVKGVELPASDPLVLAVGGTSLRANRSTGAYQGETAWNTSFSTNASARPDQEPPVASGGGFSNLFPKPGYQDRIDGSGRGVPDVSGDASPVTGMAVAYLNGGRQLIGPAAGTSASAPFWAGIVALADQYAGRHLGFINPAIYRIGESKSYHAAFHDITSGDNSVDYPGGTVTGYHATAGWDPVTGWGSPDAQVLVPLLAS